MDGFNRLTSPSLNGAYTINASKLIVDGDTLYTDNRNNKVGIGTKTPSEKLDVVGNVNTSGTYKIGGVDTLSSNLLLTGCTGSYLQSVGTLSSLTVSGDLTVDTSTLKVDSQNNRVGIGNTGPACVRIYALALARARSQPASAGRRRSSPAQCGVIVC